MAKTLPKQGGLSRPRLPRNIAPYLMILPTVLIIGVGVAFGIGYLIRLSLQQYILTSPGDITGVGLSNYIQALNDTQFWRSLRASVIWVLGSVVPQFLLGLGLALFLNREFRGRGLLRTLTIAPWAVSGVVTALMWLWIFDGTIGVLNDLLFRVGAIERPIAWGIQPDKTWFMLFVANAWRGTPFFTIMFLAALQGINSALYEAAKIDGASTWRRFLHVTLPLIRPTIIISTLLRAIWTFNYIDIILVMTRGGPIGETRTLALYLYDVAFINSNFGYAATLAVITCIVLLVFSALYWRLDNSEAA